MKSGPRPIASHARAWTVWLALLCVPLAVQASTQTAESGATEQALATFAGGCFWCVESDFDQVPGVLRTTSGYTGGELENPSYRDVTKGGSGHKEAVQIVFDPGKISYAELLEVFWRSVDPTDGGGQFCDRGESYQTTIFTHDPEQTQSAQHSKSALQASGLLSSPVVTPIVEAGPFYPAEDYHQDYYRKNPVRYKFYRYSCGRDARVDDLWGSEARRGINRH